LGPELETKRDFQRYLVAVLRYKWLVLLATLGGFGAGIGLSRFNRPEYVAQATVWLTPDQRGTSNSQGPIQQGQLLQSFGWIELLRSYVVLDPAVEELRLYLQLNSPADSAVFSSLSLMETFVPGEYRLEVNDEGTQVALRTAEGILVAEAATGDSLGQQVGFAWVPPPTALRAGMESDFTVVIPRDAARSLGERLQTRVDLDGSFLRVDLNGTNPNLIAASINSIVKRYVEVAADLKRAKLTELAQILEDQLRQGERNLRSAENALESFRIATITLPSDRPNVPVTPGLEMTRNPVFDRYFGMTVDRATLANDRTEIEQALEAAETNGLSVDAFEVIGSVQRSTEVTLALRDYTEKQAELRTLLYRYTEEYPGVQRLQAQVDELATVTIPTLMRGLLAEMDTREAQLDSRIASAGRELEEIPSRAIEEARLQREVTVAENLYTNLQQRYAEARLAEVSSVPDVRVLDEAVVPQQPVSNLAGKLIMMGIVAGMGLGVLGAILLDRVDRRVRYPDQVTAGLGLQVLGVVPRLKGGGNGVGGGESTPVVEAIRGVRLNLIHSCGAASPLVVTVTSPGPGDGKSFVASNLALAFADAGHRTLLVDGDVRRGRLHRVLGVARKPGLTDFLGGDVTREAVVQETEYSHLYFVGCGTRTPQAPELLSSAGMSQFLTSLRSAYSVILVDSPPLGAGVDAFALGTLTGNLLMVLRLGMTDRELAEAKLDVLDRLPIRVLGAVLNDVREGSAYRYYRYYSYYLPGYESEAEAGEGERKAALIEGKSA
jgi:tyrosine-protein kinase Etk/Wzc